MQFHFTSHPRLPEEIRGRAGRRGRDGPTDLGTSRPQGDPAANRACPHWKLCAASSRARQLYGELPPQVRRFPGVPRAVFNRLAPHDPRWADLSGAVPFSHVSGSSAYPPLKGLGRSIRAREADARPPYPCDPRLAGRDHAAWAAVRGLRIRITATAPTGRMSPNRSRKTRQRISAAALRPSPRFERPRARHRVGRGDWGYSP